MVAVTRVCGSLFSQRLFADSELYWLVFGVKVIENVHHIKIMKSYQRISGWVVGGQPHEFQKKNSHLYSK